jgi:ectoine hydroxylase-related dioxygenase (phytanoyl-CoA dioxygenase family)
MTISGALPAGDLVGVPYLRNVWERARRARAGRALPEDAAAWATDAIVLRGLEVGLADAIARLFDEHSTFTDFERWILASNGGSIEAERIARINAAVTGDQLPPRDGDDDGDEPVLSAAELAFWDEHGYVVLHDAVSPQGCAAAAAAVCEFLGADLRDAGTWYGRIGPSIRVPLIHHPALWANRRAPRIRRAFAQLWGRDDLWVTVDHAGFNPPERRDWRYPGPHLHWDADLVPPVRFDVHGILYLTDTAADQGAFRCVPGFHRRLDAWLQALPDGADPQKQDLAALGAVPIAGRAGDLVIWQGGLPHGASPNRADRPRIVQYITMHPSPTSRDDANAV